MSDMYTSDDEADDLAVAALVRVPERLIPTAPDERRCSAKRIGGGRCTNYAMHGASVCVSHGGSNPTTKDAIVRRMESLREPALGALEDGLHAESVAYDARRGEVITLGPDHRMRTKVAETVLDRSGIAAAHEVQVDVSVRFAELIQELDGS